MNKIITIGSIAIALTLSGCGGLHKKLDTLHQSVQNDIGKANKQALAEANQPAVTAVNGDWIAGDAVQIAPPTLPILHQSVTYHPTGLVSLADVSEWITDNTGLVVDIARLQTGSTNGSSTMNTSVAGGAGGMNMMSAGMNGMPIRQSMYMMSIDYHGTLSGLLDVVSSKSACWWKVVNGKVELYRTETKTFYLPAVSRKYAGTNDIETSLSGSASGGASANTGSTSVTSTGGVSSSGNASSNSTYSVDLWNDIKSTAKTVAAGGQVAINESAGSVTVTGTPAQVRHVEDWVHELDDQLSQQVAITFKIFNVKLKNEDNYNWNPDVLFKSAKGILNLAAAGPESPAVISGQTPANIGVSLVTNTAAGGQSTQYSGTNLAINALSTLGNVTEKISETVLTLNGQPAPIQIANQQGYLASSSTTITANVGTTTTLNPGMVTAGFTAMFVPRIVNGKVVLSMTMNDSSNNGFSTASSGNSTIQTPNIDTTSFQESVALKSGEALMLTGLSKQNGATSSNGVGKPDSYLLGGGIDNSLDKQIVAVVVSAKIL